MNENEAKHTEANTQPFVDNQFNFCQNCGTKKDKEARFCPSCGASQVSIK